MPRKYLSGSLRKSKEPDPDSIKKAIEDLKNGVSLRQCSKKYNIPVTTLHFKCNTLRKRGGQTVLTAEEEAVLVNRLQVCSDWGYPIDSLTLRLLVKDFLDRQGRHVPKFKNNTPGPDFVMSFLIRHKQLVSPRMCQNIKRSRAAVSPEVINSYFDELSKELKDIPSSNIINYDETYLCDDPGKKKLIFRPGCKYPDRIMNSTKASTSVMFSATGEGKILPPYVVYKAQHLYDSWRVGGPKNSRHNRTKSGWFDSFCFQDWVETVVMPYFKNVDGPKVLIGDNLSSHLSVDVIKSCTEKNIKFVFLPTNSTHLTQPLDVAFFRPLKIAWRKLLEEWKVGPGRYEASLPKDKFPSLLRKLFDTLKEENVISGFKKCGIVPLCRNPVLNMLPDSKLVVAGTVTTDSQSTITSSTSACVAIDDSFKELLRSLREYDTPNPKKRRTKVKVTPGKSIEVKDFDDPVEPQPGTSGGTSNLTAKKTRPKKKLNLRVAKQDSSTEEESNYSLQDSDQEFRLDSLSDKEPSFDVPGNTIVPEYFSPDDFVIVKVYGKTPSICRLYVSKVSHSQDDGYVGVFYKKLPGTKRFSETDEDAFFHPQDVLRKLQPINNAQTSSRFKNMITFKDDLDDFVLY